MEGKTFVIPTLVFQISKKTSPKDYLMQVRALSLHSLRASSRQLKFKLKFLIRCSSSLTAQKSYAKAHISDKAVPGQKKNREVFPFLFSQLRHSGILHP